MVKVLFWTQSVQAKFKVKVNKVFTISHYLGISVKHFHNITVTQLLTVFLSRSLQYKYSTNTQKLNQDNCFSLLLTNSRKKEKIIFYCASKSISSVNKQAPSSYSNSNSSDDQWGCFNRSPTGNIQRLLTKDISTHGS